MPLNLKDLTGVAIMKRGHCPRRMFVGFHPFYAWPLLETSVFSTSCQEATFAVVNFCLLKDINNYLRINFGISEKANVTLLKEMSLGVYFWSSRHRCPIVSFLNLQWNKRIYI